MNVCTSLGIWLSWLSLEDFKSLLLIHFICSLFMYFSGPPWLAHKALRIDVPNRCGLGLVAQTSAKSAT